MASGSAEARTVLHVTRTFAAPRPLVFRAWTEPELFGKWFRTPGADAPVVEMDVREGGTYRIGISQGAIGTELVGTYLDVEPPERLVYTFRWEPPVVDQMDTGETRVTVEFREHGAETEVALTHERLRADEAVRGFHEWGWIATLARLDEVLHSSAAS